MVEDIALYVGMAAVIGVIITTLKFIDSARQERKLQFAEMLERTENKLQKIFIDTRVAETAEDIDRVTSDVLNILERLAFLEHNKKIDHQIVYFFRNYFRYGSTILAKLKELDRKKIIGKDVWPDFEKWVKNNNIEKYDDVMIPPKIRMFIQRIIDAQKDHG